MIIKYMSSNCLSFSQRIIIIINIIVFNLMIAQLTVFLSYNIVTSPQFKLTPESHLEIATSSRRCLLEVVACQDYQRFSRSISAFDYASIWHRLLSNRGFPPLLIPISTHKHTSVPPLNIHNNSLSTSSLQRSPLIF